MYFVIIIIVLSLYTADIQSNIHKCVNKLCELLIPILYTLMNSFIKEVNLYPSSE